MALEQQLSRRDVKEFFTKYSGERGTWIVRIRSRRAGESFFTKIAVKAAIDVLGRPVKFEKLVELCVALVSDSREFDSSQSVLEIYRRRTDENKNIVQSPKLQIFLDLSDEMFEKVSALTWDEDPYNIFESPRYAKALTQCFLFLNKLTEREFAVIKMRFGFGSIQPKTLDEIGRIFGVSRERIRQIEKLTLAKFSSFPLVSLNNLLEKEDSSWILTRDSLNEDAALLFYPLVDFNICLYDFYRIRGELFESETKFVSGVHLSDLLPNYFLLEGVDSESYINSLFRYGIDRETALESLDILALEVSNGLIQKRQKRTLKTALTELMETLNRPVTKSEISSYIEGIWSLNSAVNLIREDTDFVRVDIEKFTLQTGAIKEYVGIHEEIQDLVKKHGPMSVDDVVLSLSGLFSVAPSSIRAYCAVAPLTIKSGLVNFDFTVASPVSFDSLPSRSRKNIFISPMGVYFRIEVTKDSLRGSGLGCGKGLASLVNLSRGNKVSIPVCKTDFEIRITYQNAQPQIGSYKGIVESLDASEGDLLFIEFIGPIGFPTQASVHLIKLGELPESYLLRAAVLCGAKEPVASPLEYLSSAFGANSTEIQTLIKAAINQGNDDIATLLRSSRYLS